ncbi:MAG: pyrroline-5-carboxylate reductase family protein [Deltaproteobacteria bacterium]
MKKKIGLIGFGNMGSAIFERARDDFDLLVYEKDPSKTEKLEASVVEKDLAALVRGVEAFILAVKPQDFTAVLAQIGGAGKATVISIAAGIPTAAIEKALPGSRVVRVMPNLPAKVGKGMSCIARGKKAAQPDVTLTEQIFRKVGQVLVIDEKMMDAATAISGSGPGFFFDRVIGQSGYEAQNYGEHIFKEELREAAVAVGFDPKQALLLAKATTDGAVELMKSSGLPAETLRDRVTSKGGTTEAGLKALHQTDSLADAARAAVARAKELAAANT